MNKFSVVWALGLLPAFAQTNTIVGAGYSAPVPLTVAPGQLVTLFVEGIGASLTQPVRASSVALPTALAGNTEAIQFRNAGSPAVGSTCFDLFAESVARFLWDAHGGHRPDSFRAPNPLSPLCKTGRARAAIVRY